jgi:hypothetical protein
MEAIKEPKPFNLDLSIYFESWQKAMTKSWNSRGLAAKHSSNKCVNKFVQGLGLGQNANLNRWKGLDGKGSMKSHGWKWLDENWVNNGPRLNLGAPHQNKVGYYFLSNTQPTWYLWIFQNLILRW